MASKDAVKAAQPASGGRPRSPKGVQQHAWNDALDAADSKQYADQIALPAHLVEDHPTGQRKSKDPRDAGMPCYLTLCGLEVGAQILRTTDVASDVTCTTCKSKGSRRSSKSTSPKRGNPRKPKRGAKAKANA